MSGRCAAARIASMFALAMVFAAGGARAGDQPSAEDIDAISHTLGFIEGMPHDGTIRIAVVYDGKAEHGRSDALRVAGAIAAAPGPGAARLGAVGIDAADIGKTSNVDALLLLPGLKDFAQAITTAAAARHLPIVSTDPQCIEQQLCVLWVQAQPRVSVTLNTKLADALSVRVSPIFAMMVTRK